MNYYNCAVTDNWFRVMNEMECYKIFETKCPIAALDRYCVIDYSCSQPSHEHYLIYLCSYC